MKTTTQQCAIFLFMASLLFAMPQFALAQWTSTQGPYGGPISSMVEFDGALYASGHSIFGGGVYRSSDEGQSWSLVNTDSAGGEWLAANDDFLFAATSNSVWRYNSTTNWDEIISESDSMHITGISTIDNTLLLGAYLPNIPLSLYSSLDNGDSLTFVISLPGFGFGVIGDDIYSGNTSGYGINRLNVDLGIWEPLQIVAMPQQPPSILVSVGNYLYAAASGGAPSIYRSANNGLDWEPVSTNFPANTSIYTLGSLDSVLYAATTSGVYRLAENSSTWDSVNTGLPDPGSYPVRSFMNMGTHLFARPSDGVYHIENNDTIWDQRNSGLSIPVLTNLLLTGPDLYVGGLTGIYRNMGGTVWAAVSPAYIQYITALTSKDGILIAITAFSQVLRSTDQGETWLQVPSSGLPDMGAVRSLLPVDTFLFAAVSSYFFGTSEIYRSSTLGDSWELAASGLGSGVTSLATTGTEIYVLSDQGVFESSTPGTTWTLAMNSEWPDSAHAGSLIANGPELYATTKEGGAFYSGNGGDNWTSINTDELEQLQITCLAANGPYLFAGTDGQGVYWSTNQGGAWAPLNWGLPGGARVISLIANSTELYAGLLGEGVWKTSLANVGISETTPNVTLFSLSPNPTTGLVTLDLTGMRDAQMVSVLDATGRVLLRKPVKGSEFTLDMRSEENGMYFVEVLSADGGRQVQKLVKH